MIQSQLFLHFLLRYHLESGQVKEAVTFAINYQPLVYFSHALEVLLHTVVELDGNSGDETDNANALLSTVVEFLDHFDVALDVVVGCARKTEPTRWPRLFSIVGNPKSLFEVSFFFRSEVTRYVLSFPLSCRRAYPLDT